MVSDGVNPKFAISSNISAPFQGPVADVSLFHRQEQQQTRKKLRARVTQAASERATLLAEIKACDSSIQAHEVRHPPVSIAASC